VGFNSVTDNMGLCSVVYQWGYRGVSPTTVRPSDPALCGSHPL